MLHQIQIASPEHLMYTNSQMTIEVLGGIKIEGLDRMRATLKVALKEHPRPPVRHNLDLYNDNQLEKFIRKCAEKLEIGTSVIAASLSELTTGLETYRLEQLKAQSAEEPKAKQLSAAERAGAIEHLKAANLLAQTLKDLQETGIQGEQANSLILYLAMTSRQCREPLSVICLAQSGTGKSYLMEKVADCIPKEATKEHTQFSGNSFYYYKREEIRGKVFLIEDLDGAQAVLFPIRELQTKKRISKTVTIKDRNGQLRTVTLIVEGPVSVIGCTTKENVYEDNANRALLIHLDGSKEQDERIMNYQKHHRAGLIDKHKEKQLQEKLQNMQSVLEPVSVINPYAPLIELPREIFKPRRTLPLLLSFIEVITFYHQYQRAEQTEESTGEAYIETHPHDIEEAFKLLKDVLFRKSDELSGAARAFYQWLQSWQQSRQLQQFYARDIRLDNRIHPRTLNRYLQELTEYGHLQIAGGNRHRTGYAYRIIAEKDFEQVRNSIETQIKQVVDTVWQAYRNRKAEQEAAAGKTKSKKSKPVSHQSDSNANV